jgi:flagellar protein FliJ
MKSRDSNLKIKRFEVSEKARKVADLESMIRDFEGMVADLDRQISTEEERTGVKDQAHFAYSTFAKSAAVRKDKLVASVDGLRAQLGDAQKAHETAVAELRAVESVGDPRDDRGQGRIAKQDKAPPAVATRPLI